MAKQALWPKREKSLPSVGIFRGGSLLLRFKQQRTLHVRCSFKDNFPHFSPVDKIFDVWLFAIDVRW